jgi:hypothetical protein
MSGGFFLQLPPQYQSILWIDHLTDACEPQLPKHAYRGRPVQPRMRAHCLRLPYIASSNRAPARACW